MTIEFNYVHKEDNYKLAKVNIPFFISKHTIASIIAEYISEDGNCITNFVKETTKKWTKAEIERKVKRRLLSSGLNFYDDYTEEQYEKALEIVENFWEA